MSEGTTATTATTAVPTQQTTQQTTQQAPATKQTPAHQAQQRPQSVFEQNAAQTKGAEKQTPEAQADDWSEDHDKQLAELLSRKSKKDPNFRLRHKGEEKALESLDDLKAAIMDAQRGRGANKLVEEAKKERESIAQQRQQIEAIQQAFASGDPELAEAALKLLAGDSAYDLAQSVAERRQKQQDEYAGLSDRERQLLERNKALESEFQRLQAEEAKQKEEAISRQKQERIKQLSAQARENTKAIVESLGYDESAMLAYGPHVVSVMREAIELGQELGRDIPFEQVKALAEQRAQASVIEPVRKMSPKAFIGAVGKEYAVAIARELVASQGRPPTQQSMKQAQAMTKQEPKQDGPQLGTYEYLKSLRGR